MASADALGGEIKGIVADRLEKIQRINSSSSSSSGEEEAAKTKKTMKVEPTGEKGDKETTPATKVAKTKAAVKNVEKLLALIREASGKEKSGKIAFLREDQVAVKNATFDIQSQVQRLMLIILEMGEDTRKAEEGRRKAVEEAKNATMAAKVSARVGPTTGRQTETRKESNHNNNAGNNNNNKTGEQRTVWQGARPRTGIWANQREAATRQTGVEENNSGSSSRERGRQQGSVGMGATGGWTKVVSKTDRLRKSTEEIQETVVKMTGKTGDEVKKMLNKKLNLEEMGGPLERVVVRKDGSVILVSRSKEQREQVEAQVKKTCGEEMEVKEGAKLRPTVTVTVRGDMKTEEIVEEVWRKNGWIRERRTWEEFQRDFKDLARRTCRKDKTMTNATFCVEPKLQKEMVERGKLVVGLTRCFVEEVIAVTRCFQCNGYGHRAKDCKGNQTCIRCGKEGHKSNECRALEKRCSNCVKAGLRGDHHVMDRGCPIYRRRLEAKMCRTARC